ncbi:hypothetical protein BBJ28_00024563 [Nothophytophthora sp. Chile5]|nr:hypothetical protein BBJ28_00024563 [Nothophytophthora sp. Chile5]
MWWGIDVLTPEMSEGLPLGKRILVQDTKLTTITDMLRSTWFSLVTFTTVGYGDLYPRTILGKLFDIVGTIFSACYTAMPLTLVGGQFYICYDVYAKEEKRLRVSTLLEGDWVLLSLAFGPHIVCPSVASVEMDTLNHFILVHKVFNEMIEDLSTLNRLGTERITAARKGALTTALLNFAPVIECVLGTPETPSSPPPVTPTTPLLTAEDPKSIQKKTDTTLTKDDASHSNNSGGITSNDVQLASPTTSNVETPPSAEAYVSESPSS